MTEMLKFIIGEPEKHLADEYIDRVEIKQVDRFKQSGLSGDEWRFNTVMEFFRKDMLMWTCGFHKMYDAASVFPWVINAKFQADMMQETREELDERARKRREMDKYTCFQPGCAKPGLHFFRMKKLHSPSCSFERVLEPNERCYRCFCTKHKNRGDCSLDDSDKSYIHLFSIREDRLLEDEHFKSRAHLPTKIRGGYTVEFPAEWSTEFNVAHAVSEDPS